MKITKQLKLCLMLAPMVNFWGCQTHRMGMDTKGNIQSKGNIQLTSPIYLCTKETNMTTSRNCITGTTTTTTKTTITPCDKEDCPAKKQGFGN